VVEISKSDQRDDTKSIGIQPVYYRKIEHKMESYNTCSIVIKKAEFGLKTHCMQSRGNHRTYVVVRVLYSKISLSRPSQTIFLLATSKIDTQRSLSKRSITVPAESGDLTNKDLKAQSHIRGHPRNE
jgi:hypothetical protein